VIVSDIASQANINKIIQNQSNNIKQYQTISNNIKQYQTISNIHLSYITETFFVGAFFAPSINSSSVSSPPGRISTGDGSYFVQSLLKVLHTALNPPKLPNYIHYSAFEGRISVCCYSIEHHMKQ